MTDVVIDTFIREHKFLVMLFSLVIIGGFTFMLSRAGGDDV